MKDAVEEGNKLIAEFMGYNVTVTHDTTPEGNGEAFIKYSKGGITTDRVFYNSSWDDLMPVVEKIEKMEYNTNLECTEVDYGGWQNYFSIYKNQMDTSIVTVSLPVSEATKIIVVWKAVVQFIKWYNLNKQ